MVDIDKIEERLSKVTPGPWKATQFGVLDDCFWGVKAECGDEIIPHDFDHVCSMEFSPFDDAQPNAEFVAHAKQDVRNLIDELKDIREICSQLQVSLSEHRKALVDLFSVTPAEDCLPPELYNIVGMRERHENAVAQAKKLLWTKADA